MEVEFCDDDAQVDVMASCVEDSADDPVCMDDGGIGGEERHPSEEQEPVQRRGTSEEQELGGVRSERESTIAACGGGGGGVASISGMVGSRERPQGRLLAREEVLGAPCQGPSPATPPLFQPQCRAADVMQHSQMKDLLARRMPQQPAAPPPLEPMGERMSLLQLSAQQQVEVGGAGSGGTGRSCGVENSRSIEAPTVGSRDRPHGRLLTREEALAPCCQGPTQAHPPAPQQHMPPRDSTLHGQMPDTSAVAMPPRLAVLPPVDPMTEQLQMLKQQAQQQLEQHTQQAQLLWDRAQMQRELQAQQAQQRREQEAHQLSCLKQQAQRQLEQHCQMQQQGFPGQAQQLMQQTPQQLLEQGGVQQMQHQIPKEASRTILQQVPQRISPPQPQPALLQGGSVQLSVAPAFGSLQFPVSAPMAGGSLRAIPGQVTSQQTIGTKQPGAVVQVVLPGSANAAHLTETAHSTIGSFKGMQTPQGSASTMAALGRGQSQMSRSLGGA